MDNLLLKIAGVTFLLSLAVSMIRMFFFRGSKLRALGYLLVYAVVLFGFARLIDIDNIIHRGLSGEDMQAVELQSVESQDYPAGLGDSYTLGIQAIDSRDYLQAIELLSEVIPGDPNYEAAQAKLAQARLFYARQLLDEGRRTMFAGAFDQAVRLLDQSLKYDPDLVEAKKLKLEAISRKQSFLEAEASQNLQQDREHTARNEVGAEKLSILIKKTKVTEVIPTDLGFSYTSRGDERFLWVFISCVNQGKTAVAVSPDDFYISGPHGSRIARSEATFSQGHLPVMTVKPDSTAEGWVIFYIAGQKQYTVYYYGDGYIVDKDFVV